MRMRRCWNINARRFRKPSRRGRTSSTASYRNGSGSDSGEFEPASQSGRLARTGFVSILPVDQGISIRRVHRLHEPDVLRPENIVKLASRAAAAQSRARWCSGRRCEYAHKIPFLMKFNRNEFLSYPVPSTRSCSPTSARRSTWDARGLAQPSLRVRESSARSGSHRDVHRA